MQPRNGTLRLILALTIIITYVSCGPTEEKKPATPAPEKQSEALAPAVAGLLADSLYTLAVDVAEFATYKNKVMFTFELESSGKLQLQSWNPPFPKPGGKTEKPIGAVKATVENKVKITIPISLASLFLEDKKAIDDVIKKVNGKFVLFVPEINDGQINYTIFVSDALPSAAAPATPLAITPTGVSLNPSPPYSNQ